MRLAEWIRRFEGNRENRGEPEWEAAVELKGSALAKVLSSLEQFELGDGGGPASLIAFDARSFACSSEEFAKAHTYWSFFNLVRKNRGKEWQSPLQILLTQAPALAGALIHWQPLNLSRRHHAYLPKGYTGGHDVPRYP